MSIQTHQLLESRTISETQSAWEAPQDAFTQKVKAKQRAGKPISIIGPCALQSAEQAKAIAHVIDGQVDAIRLPTKKPRTRPVDRNGNRLFEGTGNQIGRDMYVQLLRDHPQLLIAAEVMSGQDITDLAPLLSLAWSGARTTSQEDLRSIGVGARNHNKLPVMVKNSLVRDLETFLGMMENVALGGESVIPLLICLRGTVPTSPTEKERWRNTPNLDWIPVLRQSFPKLPIIADVSHPLRKDRTTVSDQVSLIEDALAAGADGYIAEVHHPDHPSLTDPGVSVEPFLNQLVKGNLL